MIVKNLDYYRNGIAVEAEYSPVMAPDDPGVGENHGFWVFDDGQRFAFFVHLEAGSRLWGARREWVELIMANGSVYYGWQYGRLTDASGPGSASTKATCIEPFSRWKLSYEGFLHVASGVDMACRQIPDASFEPAAVQLEADLSMAGPAWQQGTMHRTNGSGYSADAKNFMGGTRYEQLHHASGVLHINGEAIPFSGRGIRTHRFGRRDLTRMVGHSWHTVTFPSGRAYGCHRFADPDQPSRSHYTEAFVQNAEGVRYPAEVIRSMHCLDTPLFAGQSYIVELESDLGRSVIQCDTVALGHITVIADDQGRHRIAFGTNLDSPQHQVLNHGITKNTWDGETAIGLLERSARVELLTSVRGANAKG